MFHKIADAFRSYAFQYMETCAENGMYGVYVDMVRDQMKQMEQNER